MKLHIKAFFFNAQTDYLPYYKRFTVTLNEEAKTKDLLAAIQTQNETFEYPKQKLICKINGLVVTANEKIATIVGHLGTELQIDPVSSYRANNCLRFNDSDFMESYALLEPYCDEEDLKFYKTLYALHYASETSNYQRNYIGDALLVLAHRLIANAPQHKAAILKTIIEAESGLHDCEYENNLFDAQDHTQTINELKAMLHTDAMPSIFETLLSKITGKKTEEKVTLKTFQRAIPSTVKSINGKNAAYYIGAAKADATVAKAIRKAGAQAIAFAKANKYSGSTIFENSRTLALKKAGTILLDALDSGAEVLIVEERTDCTLFSQNLKEIEKIMGRDIALDIILAFDFLSANQSVAA